MIFTKERDRSLNRGPEEIASLGERDGSWEYTTYIPLDFLLSVALLSFARRGRDGRTEKARLIAKDNGRSITVPVG